MGCRRDIWSRSCRRWSATEFCAASVDRAAATARRERRRIAADDILRAAGSAEETNGLSLAESTLVHDVVVPALAQAETAFAGALARINVEDLANSAQGLEERAGAA